MQLLGANIKSGIKTRSVMYGKRSLHGLNYKPKSFANEGIYVLLGGGCFLTRRLENLKMKVFISSS